MSANPRCLSCAVKDRTIKELGDALDELSADFERMAAVTEQLVQIEEQRQSAAIDHEDKEELTE